MKPLMIDFFCIENALEFSTKAKAIYNQILETWRTPGCQALLNGNFIMPATEFKAWEESILQKKEYEPKDIVFHKASDDKANDADYVHLVELIAEFIKAGFNHKKGLSGYVYKISIDSSEFLPLAVLIYSAGEYQERRPNLGIEPKLTIGDKTLDIAPLSGVEQERTHRLHTKLFKQYGFSMMHDKKIKELAYWWYQSRVVYSGIDEFCERIFNKTGIILDPDNVDKEIKIVDIATGYPRKNS